jgi:hypothetical protein
VQIRWVVYHQPSALDQIDLLWSLVHTGAGRNPAASGIHQGNMLRRFTPPLSEGWRYREDVALGGAFDRVREEERHRGIEYFIS